MERDNYNVGTEPQGDDDGAMVDSLFYQYTILLRFRGKYVFLLRRGDVGESRFVVEPVGEDRDDFLLHVLQDISRILRRRPLEDGYNPDELDTMAKILTEKMKGEVLAVNKPPSEPLPPGMVY